MISYDTVGRGIPYFSAATSFDTDVKLIKSIIPVLSALIEYRPPTKENVNELISGGFTSVKLIKQQFIDDYKHDNADEQLTAE